MSTCECASFCALDKMRFDMYYTSRGSFDRGHKTFIISFIIYSKPLQIVGSVIWILKIYLFIETRYAFGYFYVLISQNPRVLLKTWLGNCRATATPILPESRVLIYSDFVLNLCAENLLCILFILSVCSNPSHWVLRGILLMSLKCIHAKGSSLWWPAHSTSVFTSTMYNIYIYLRSDKTCMNVNPETLLLNGGLSYAEM